MASKKKTIQEWLEELPEPHRAQAIDNYKEQRGGKIDTYTDAITLALTGAFAWGKTPEGFDYWNDFYGSFFQKQST